jgi:hypothetical protein
VRLQLQLLLLLLELLLELLLALLLVLLLRRLRVHVQQRRLRQRHAASDSSCGLLRQQRLRLRRGQVGQRAALARRACTGTKTD